MGKKKGFKAMPDVIIKKYITFRSKIFHVEDKNDFCMSRRGEKNLSKNSTNLKTNLVCKNVRDL